MKKKILFLSMVIIIPLMILPVFADDFLQVETNKQEYVIDDELEIFGKVQEKKMPELALRIYDPDGFILSANNVVVDEDNQFSKSISLESPFYDKLGIYRITVDYGVLSSHINFEIISSVQKQTIDSFQSEVVTESILMKTSKQVYFDNEFIEILGSISYLDSPSILIGIHDPFGFPAGFYFAPINSNNEFSVEFMAKSGVNFKTEGTYSAVAHYGDTKKTIYFDFSKTKIIEESIEEEIVEELICGPGTVIEGGLCVVMPKESIEEEIVEELICGPGTVIEGGLCVVMPKESIEEEKTIEKEILTIPGVTKQKTITPTQQNFDNLSVDDSLLESILNENKSNCDTGLYDYSISYDDGMGSALVRLCKYEQAITFYDQILVNDPKNIVVLNDKASALSNLRLFDEAILHYDSVLSIKPDFVPALNNKANTLIQLKQFDQGILLYEESLEIDPENIILIRNLEKAKFEYSNYDVSQIPTNSNNNELKKGITQNEKNSFNSLGLFENVFSSIEGFFSLFS